MISRDELLAYCDALLDVASFKDYSPNGLQVQGRESIQTIVAGVTASQALLDAAIARQADAVLVHHGYFWRGEDPRIIGMKGARIASLIKNDISLIGYHLPLDAHAEYGNNVGLGRALGFNDARPVPETDIPGLLWYTDLPTPITASELHTNIRNALDREPLYVEGGQAIKRVVWCTGGAQGYIDQAADFHADAYITGEASEQTAHIARERGLHFFSAGHHATERFGARALLDHLAGKFCLDSHFIDVPNPI
ncbi:MAG: Nif3-like dinuclear metal center hexameric protein [Pseudomonadota bacterium]